MWRCGGVDILMPQSVVISGLFTFWVNRFTPVFGVPV